MTQSDAGFNRIIFVDDDPSFLSVILKYLQKSGYPVTSVSSAIDFYRELDKQPYALAIIDVGLPDQCGLVLTKYVRENSSTRILLLSGDTSPETRIEGYEAGADQFLTKPVNFRLLDAAVANLIERAARQTDGLSEVLISKVEEKSCSHTWRLLTEGWALVTPAGEKLHLTGKEYVFIHKLVETPSVPVSRTILLKELGYSHDEHGNRSLESLIYRLRKKISPNLETPVKTVNGTGYIFTAKIEIEN
jgi:DNA-binding response OmpR family regulator